MSDDHVHAVDDIVESKNIGTHRGLAPLRTDRDLTHAVQRQLLTPRVWNRLSAGVRQEAGRNFEVLRHNFEQNLRNIVGAMMNGQLSVGDARRQSRKVFVDFYRRAFQAGLHGSGAGISWNMTTGGGLSGAPPLHDVDLDYVQSAIEQEQKFWRGFLGQIEDGSIAAAWRRYTPAERIGLYADSLEAQFDAGRIAGAPLYSLIYWVANHGIENCPSCLYLEGMSPWPKELLPTTPKAGLTPCRTNCGCRVRVMPSNIREYQREMTRFPQAHVVMRRLQLIFRDPRPWSYDPILQDFVRSTTPSLFRVAPPRHAAGLMKKR